MDFARVQLDQLLQELVELQAEWMDETAVRVIEHVKSAVPLLRAAAQVTPTEIEAAFRADPLFLDVCRLFLGVSQETAAHRISAHLQRPRSWTQLRRLAVSSPEEMTAAVVALGLPAVIEQELKKRWTVEDVLVDRYRMSRGRAITGQARGRSLEDRVEQILTGVVPFEQRVTFVGREGRSAKCDVAIPSRDHPKIVIEAKGFEATASKLTDFLGDIGKII